MPEKPTNNPPQSTFQPKPYNSGLVRKMLTLTAMLVMVLYSMKEAGKPENWAWMGFEAPAGPREENNNSGTPKVAAKTNANNTNANASPNSDRANAASVAADPTNKSARPSPAPLNTPVIRLAQASATAPFSQGHQQTELPTDSGRFWTSFFANLKTTEQLEWMSLLEALSGNQPATRSPASQAQAKLIDLAEKRRDAFSNKSLDQIASLPQASEKRSQVSQNYFEANKLWQNQISPALAASKAAEDITLRQQQAMASLLSHLDIDALNLVQDKTAVGWTGDTVAWKRCWNRIHQSQIGKPAYVTRIQLAGQPQEFRGDAITVNGFVRSIETRRANPDSSIVGPNTGDEEQNYYILWVQPADSDAGPYCVYCLNPPEQLPHTQAELKDYQWLAKISGIFFKNRTYQATDRVRYSPLILANRFEMKPPVTDHPALKWKLSPKLMAGLLALIPLVAVSVVWYAVRSTVNRKRLPSKKSQEELNIFLGDLKDNPSIKNDLEQIQAISEHEDDIT